MISPQYVSQPAVPHEAQAAFLTPCIAARNAS